MITEINVNGFKSLNKFQMKLKSGLNILVGPNGSGKTNIISFFEFLSYLQESEIHEAISLTGGAGSIFTKKGDTEFGDSIECEIYGGRLSEGKKFIKYRYSFNISVDNKAGQIYFKRQQLSITTVQKRVSVSKRSSSKTEWDLDIVATGGNGADRSVDILKLDRRKIKSRYTYSPNREEINDSIKFNIQRNINKSITSILSREFEVIRPVILDMIGGEVLNIIPSKVKQPEDIAKEPGIKKDGTGLAATLFAIKNRRFRKVYPSNIYYGYRNVP